MESVICQDKMFNGKLTAANCFASRHLKVGPTVLPSATVSLRAPDNKSISVTFLKQKSSRIIGLRWFHDEISISNIEWTIYMKLSLAIYSSFLENRVPNTELFRTIFSPRSMAALWFLFWITQIVIEMCESTMFQFLLVDSSERCDGVVRDFTAQVAECYGVWETAEFPPFDVTRDPVVSPFLYQLSYQIQTSSC